MLTAQKQKLNSCSDDVSFTFTAHPKKKVLLRAVHKIKRHKPTPELLPKEEMCCSMATD